MVTWIVLGVVVVVVLFAISAYNRLVSLNQQVKASWAHIDVALKRRHDLIPQIVETVKGYMQHERQTLESVVAARNIAAAPGAAPAERLKAEAGLTGALQRIFALAESYPDLKANTNFLQLQGELANTENQISGQRQQYNTSVASYNTSLQSFPNNLIAGPFGFITQPFFEIDNAAERVAPQVNF